MDHRYQVEGIIIMYTSINPVSYSSRRKERASTLPGVAQLAVASHHARTDVV